MSNNSSDETSSTDYTTDSSDDDGMETAQIDDSRLQLPQALCERQDIFREFFNADLWNSISDSNKQHLQTFLPTFPENDEAEKGRTLQKLFDGEIFRFHSPLLKFHEDLKAGYFRPDIARMRKIIQRAEHKESKYRYKSFRNQLKQEVIESQRKLLEQIRSLPPGVEPKSQKRKPAVDYVAHRTKRRYFQILAAIRAKAADEDGAANNECSSDENYPEGPPVPLSRKQKRHLNSVRNCLTGNKEQRCFHSTMAPNLAIDLERYITPSHNPFYINDEAYRHLMQQHRKRKLENPDDPGLCTRGMTISDIIHRTQLPYLKNLPSHPKLESKLEKSESKSSRKRKRAESHRVVDLFQNSFTGKLTRSSISDSDSDTTTTTTDTVLSKSAKSRMKKTRTPTPKKEKVVKEEPIIDVVSTTPPVISSAISPKLSVITPKLAANSSKSVVTSTKVTANSPKMTAKVPNTSSPPKTTANSPKMAATVPKIPANSPKATPKTITAIPTLVPPSNSPLPPPISLPSVVVNNNLNIKEINSLTQLSQYGKITPAKVEDLEGIDMMNLPIVDLANPEIDILELSKPELMQETHANFFALIRDVICSTTEHRMNMYTLQERLKLWQENPISPLNDWYHLSDNWIGLLPSAITFLCGNSSEQPDDFVPYMEYKTVVDSYQWIGAGRDSDVLLSNLCSFWLDHRSENKQVTVIKKEIEEVEVDVVDRVQTPPPPRCPTNWTVRKATPEEVKDFREQERRRYANPHKAFTYRCNGYESVVGPLKGIYNAAVLGNNTKARGHTMLNADRPNFVTILSLVRDATARLPNGEGTRSDICELLKSSQYISSTAPDNVLQSVVSGALDRMHTQFDPCVKYDPKRKIWIYLHRNRTEEDFERIHQQYQGMNKNMKKSSNKKSPKAAKPRSKKMENDKVAAAVAAVTAIAPQSIQDIKKANVSVIATASPNTTNAVAKGTSLLISNANLVSVSNANSLITSTSTANLITSDITPTLASISDTKTKTLLVDKEATIQTIVQTTSARSSPTIKGGKSLVKILAPGQGKSLIIPTTNAQLIKQIQRASPTKQINQAMTQQLLQNIVAQQKQLLAQQKLTQSTVVMTEVAPKLTVVSAGDTVNTIVTTTTSVTAAPPSEGKIKVQSQHIIHPITPQQLQNIKNVTLLRGPNQITAPLAAISSAASDSHNSIVTVAVSKAAEQTQQQPPQLQPSVQIKTHGNLTPAQQQQILQTIKQKILPQTNVLQSQQQQQIILKQQKAGAVPPKLAGTSILTNQQSKIGEGATKVVAGSQGPVVAKVVTNAAGQVISVESLLAHQKQHGSLPQGTTLRVASSKAGQQNIIHLTGSSKPNTITQFAVASQNSLIALTSQPKLVISSPTTTTTTVTATKSTSQRTTTKSQPVTKFTPKVAQQLINAKIITQNLDGQKLVQPKLVMSQQPTNQSKLSPVKATPLTKPVTLSVAGAAGANTIRMVNAANLNLTHIAGKPVLLASKGGTLQNIQGQNIVLQAPNSSGASLVLQPGTVKNANATTIASTNSINLLNQQNIVFGPQVKVQQPQMVFSTPSGGNTTKSGVSTASATQTISQAQHLVIGGHPVRLQTSNASNNAQRVVLASQGQGGQLLTQQFLLPAGFQGTAINIKALQGVKVIPIGQAGPQGKGGGRPVFARVMSPGIIKSQHVAAAVPSTVSSTTSTPPPASLVEISKNSPTDPAPSSS